MSADKDRDIDLLVDTVRRLEDHLREVTSITCILAALHGRDVGLGSYQLRIPAEVAFEVRQKLPGPNPQVSMDLEAGELVITVI